jgi:hypothetical protein
LPLGGCESNRRRRDQTGAGGMMARQKGGAPAEPVGRVSPHAICACRNSMRRWGRFPGAFPHPPKLKHRSDHRREPHAAPPEAVGQTRA